MNNVIFDIWVRENEVINYIFLRGTFSQVNSPDHFGHLLFIEVIKRNLVIGCKHDVVILVSGREGIEKSARESRMNFIYVIENHVLNDSYLIVVETVVVENINGRMLEK